uniref:TIR domain-containing protein n=1 Tax=Ciona savignyi TaxID=51511 RepID=H2Y4T3_CIOSA
RIIASCVVFSTVRIAASITWAASNCTIKVTSGRFVPRRYYVNCSNLRMPDLPRGRLPTVGVLDMTGNSVTTVGVESFRSSCGAFKVTRTLDLSNNLISSIHNDSFGCFVALERLHLQLNNIDILFRWVFRGLAKLKVLNLSANSLVQVPQQSIGGLPRLESLDLSANPLHDFQVSLYNQARYVDLAGNWFTSFRSGEIDTALEGINVSHCKIQDLEKGSLPLLTNITLRTLDLSSQPDRCISDGLAPTLDPSGIRRLQRQPSFRNNHNLTHVAFNQVDGIQRGLNAGMFSGLKVKFLFLSKCNIRQISSSAFNGSTHMKVIDLSWNKISMIPGSLFRHNPMLEVINLRGNRISQMEPAAFAFLAHLPTRTLDLSNNLISSIHNDSFGCFVALERLHLQLNNIDILFRWVFRGLAKLKVLNLIRIRYTTINTVGGYTFSDVAGLRRIDLSHNKLASVHSAAFSDVPSLREIDLSNNNLQRVPASLFDPANRRSHQLGLEQDIRRHAELLHNSHHRASIALQPGSIRPRKGKSALLTNITLRTLDLSYNRIAAFPTDWLRHLIHLEYVDYSGNRVLHSPFPVKAFRNNRNLTHFLFLSKCNIRQISSSAFNGSTHMKVIDLSWNKISMIPGSLFRHNPMLEVINLRGNRISQMEPAAFAFLAHLRSLDVQNNRFLCDCDIVPLQQWIIENTYTTARHRRRILFENATCFQQSSHAYLEMLRWDAGKQCWMKSTVVTGIAFASVLLVVCCVAFAYSSRFQALFWYEMVKAKISYRRKVPADAFGGNEYNAYISCVPDSNDEAWVVRHLLSAIENPPYELEPMKLCFPSRDFRPGRPKTASAASGIRSAERTLVILSAGYARCSWTRLELSMVSEMWRSGERSAESLVVVYLK